MIESSLAYTETGRVRPLIQTRRAHPCRETGKVQHFTQTRRDSIALNVGRYEADLAHKHVKVMTDI